MKTYDNKPILYMKDLKGRFMPVDWQNGITTNRRIFATMFTVEEKVKVEQSMAHPKNKHLEWEWRK